LFHEFGHALHGMLADTQYPTLSGTSVKWDFVELPSQFLENFCYEPEFLKTFAKHYKTGEVFLMKKLRKLHSQKLYGRLSDFETAWFRITGYELPY
jgi:peptidyl-dipeptidase Dcp